MRLRRVLLAMAISKWDVSVNGKNHTIEIKRGFGALKVVVDGQIEKVRSQNFWIMLLDREIRIEDKVLNLVMIGSKADLAVDGVFLGSGKKYAPVKASPQIWIAAFATICGMIACILVIINYLN